MAQLTLEQTALFFLIFTWSGFVRTALGFGGAALSLPLFLFIVDNPVEIVPIIGIHLLISVIINLRHYHRYIDWNYLGKTLPLMLPFKLAGVIGLLNLPAHIITIGVYLITLLYAVSYITQIRWQSQSNIIDNSLLAGGSYISGTSLIGAPLIIAVYGKHLPPSRLRATLFALWFILVTIKMLAFAVSGTALQITWAMYTLPFSLLGHYIGDKVHQHILTVERSLFMRWIGLGLLSICLLGLARLIFITP